MLKANPKLNKIQRHNLVRILPNLKYLLTSICFNKLKFIKKTKQMKYVKK
jgi:hypothetical protein